MNFFGVAVRKLPSLCIIHLAGIGGRNGVRRRAVLPDLLLCFGVVCIADNVGLENSIIIRITYTKEKKRRNTNDLPAIISSSVRVS